MKKDTKQLKEAVELLMHHKFSQDSTSEHYAKEVMGLGKKEALESLYEQVSSYEDNSILTGKGVKKLVQLEIKKRLEEVN